MYALNIDVLRGAFLALNKNASAGIDEETRADYEQEREPQLRDLHARLHRGAYRALPSRRVMIPKPDGGERPLGIAAIEDKIVQMAVVMILTPIYEVVKDIRSYGHGARRRTDGGGSPTPRSRGCAPDSGNMPSGTLACPASGSGCARPAG